MEGTFLSPDSVKNFVAVALVQLGRVGLAGVFVAVVVASAWLVRFWRTAR